MHLLSFVQFFNQLETSRDGFQTIAEYCGKGVFAKCTQQEREEDSSIDVGAMLESRNNRMSEDTGGLRVIESHNHTHNLGGMGASVSRSTRVPV